MKKTPSPGQDLCCWALPHGWPSRILRHSALGTLLEDEAGVVSYETDCERGDCCVLCRSVELDVNGTLLSKLTVESWVEVIVGCQ